jgi:putative endopeptidase
MHFRNLILASALIAAVPALALAAAPKFGDWGYDATAMDRGVKPGDDFFGFVNGSWLKRTEIAPDRTFAGIDSILNDQIDKDVRDIIQDSAKNPASSGPLGQQVGDFYASWMDQPGVEARGIAPAQPYLDKIAAVHDRGGLTDLFGSIGYTSPIPLFIESDPKNPRRYAVFATQDGLGMPNRDYYLLQGA